MLLRTGLVLAPEGGFLGRLLPLYRLGLGGPLGDGRQWMPWIHIEDQIELIDFLLRRPDASGPYNACAPNPVRNRDFAKALGRALHKPARIPTPGSSCASGWEKCPDCCSAASEPCRNACRTPATVFNSPTWTWRWPMSWTPDERIRHDRECPAVAQPGLPDSTRVEDVRRYLDQFLMDPYVVDLPWPLRRLLVSLILIKRPAESAHAYSSIWWDEGSPLIVLSRRLQEAMKPHWPHGPVELAMRYGQPAIEKVLLDLARRGIQRVTLAPLYPQFADSTTTTAEQEVRRVIAAHRLGLEVSTLPPFYDQPVYLDALVESVRPYLQQPHDHLLLSFHGLPERHIRKLVKDPAHDLLAENSRNVSPEALALCYRSQCLRTAEAFAERAGLEQGRWSVSFQSRLGRAKWIEPYTDAKLDELVQRGVKRLLVMCPAFVADCIETLEEIGMRGREQFISAGGEDLVLIPCLNDHPAWVGALADMSGRLARAL